MGLGGRKGRPRLLSAIAGMVATIAFLTAGARAEGTPEAGADALVLLPVVCTHPLGTGPVGNPACSSPTPIGAIYGIVYIDTNEDGQYEPEEDTVEGSQVLLQRTDCAEPLPTLASGGYYCFEGLEPGEYAVTVTLSAKDRLLLSLLDGASGPIWLREGENAVRNFRYARVYRSSFTLYLPFIAR